MFLMPNLKNKTELFCININSELHSFIQLDVLNRYKFDVRVFVEFTHFFFSFLLCTPVFITDF